MRRMLVPSSPIGSQSRHDSLVSSNVVVGLVASGIVYVVYILPWWWPRTTDVEISVPIHSS